MSKHAVVTGGAGFIGSHLAERLLIDGWRVTVVDNFDDFYDPALKEGNVSHHLGNDRYTLVRADIRDLAALDRQLRESYHVIVHLAARAGVRPSIERPLLYQDVNVRGTHNVLEFARARGIPQFVFASSSSVYGVNPKIPWREDDSDLQPISPYASTKISGELLGHVYSRLFGIRFIALRFFTVFGPRQRPDLAIRSFAQRILAEEPIPIFGDGHSLRDYTYIDDIVDGICAAMRYRASGYEVINLGNNRPVRLLELVIALESVLGRRARIEQLPDQPGDVPRTCADITKAQRLLAYAPRTSLADGLEQFASWLRALDQRSRQPLSPSLVLPFPVATPATASETTLNS